MKFLGIYFSLGEGWKAIAKEILEKGESQVYTDNPGEEFEVLEVFGLNVVFAESALPDAVFEEYQDPAEVAWMEANLKEQKRVKELHNAHSYAQRFYDYMGVKNQLQWAKKRLSENPFQRALTITTLEPLEDEGYIPCVSLLDFQIRPKTDILDLYVYCRAIDFGSKGYVNLMMLRLILEQLAEELHLSVGSLEMIVKSAHIRKEDLERVRKILC